MEPAFSLCFEKVEPGFFVCALKAVEPGFSLCFEKSGTWISLWFQDGRNQKLLLPLLFKAVKKLLDFTLYQIVKSGTPEFHSFQIRKKILVPLGTRIFFMLWKEWKQEVSLRFSSCFEKSETRSFFMLWKEWNQEFLYALKTVEPGFSSCFENEWNQDFLYALEWTVEPGFSVCIKNGGTRIFFMLWKRWNLDFLYALKLVEPGFSLCFENGETWIFFTLWKRWNLDFLYALERVEPRFSLCFENGGTWIFFTFRWIALRRLFIVIRVWQKNYRNTHHGVKLLSVMS